MEKTDTPEQLLANLVALSDAYITGRPAVPCQVHIQLTPPQPAASVATPNPQPSQPVSSGATPDSIAAKIAACTRCQLCQTRTNTVPGMGVPHPVVLVIGEGPGQEEDLQGLPFVGPAGQLLDKMLASISLSRTTNTYIANIVKCRPPHNRDPQPEEAAACRSYLDAQISVLKPKLILCMGRIAAQHMLDTPQGINRLRGQWFQYRDIPLMATYHPSALLRDQELKRPAWEDLKLFRQRLAPYLQDTDAVR